MKFSAELFWDLIGLGIFGFLLLAGLGVLANFSGGTL